MGGKSTKVKIRLSDGERGRLNGSRAIREASGSTPGGRASSLARLGTRSDTRRMGCRADHAFARIRCCDPGGKSVRPAMRNPRCRRPRIGNEPGMARAVTRCAHRRWAIENETFKTLKSRDMHGFEHTCGHGGNHLRDVFGVLAMLSFLIDQVRQSCRGMFQRVPRHQGRNLHLRDDLRSLVRRFAFPDRETLYRGLAGEPGGEDHVRPVRSRPRAARLAFLQFTLDLAKAHRTDAARPAPVCA